jgi:tetratricopeptide (TPR) repeat protein
MMTGAGNLPPAPSFSLQESLVARGNYREAVSSYEEHLERSPGDFHARLALASLWRDHLNDPGAAERLLLEARRKSPPHNVEFAIGNALIDLYHRSGQRGRELAELARFAERFKGTAEGARAREALVRIKAGDA